MSHVQLTMLLGAAAYSLVSMVFIYFLTLLMVKIFTKHRPSILRIMLGFAGSWMLTSFYLPFKSVDHYIQNSGEMYIAELIFSVIAMFAVIKLSPTKMPPPSP